MTDVPVPEKEPTLSDNLGGLGCGLVALVAGGGLIAAGWGSFTNGLGALLAVVGVIVTNVMFFGVLKSLLRRKG